MDNTTTPIDIENIYLVWFERGENTERRFLIVGKENVLKEVELLNEYYRCKDFHLLEPGEDPGDYDTSEYWTYEKVDFHNPYLPR